METCEYCREEVDFTEATSEVGAYCMACHQLTIANSQEAIRTIREKRKANKTMPDKRKHSEEKLKEAMDKSLADLLGGPSVG